MRLKSSANFFFKKNSASMILELYACTQLYCPESARVVQIPRSHACMKTPVANNNMRVIWSMTATIQAPNFQSDKKKNRVAITAINPEMALMPCLIQRDSNCQH